MFEILATAKLEMIAAVRTGADECTLLNALYDSWRAAVLSKESK